MTDIEIKYSKDEMKGICIAGIIGVTIWFVGCHVPRMIRKCKQNEKRLIPKESARKNQEREA